MVEEASVTVTLVALGAAGFFLAVLLVLVDLPSVAEEVPLRVRVVPFTEVTLPEAKPKLAAPAGRLPPARPAGTATGEATARADATPTGACPSRRR